MEGRGEGMLKAASANVLQRNNFPVLLLFFFYFSPLPVFFFPLYLLSAISATLGRQRKKKIFKNNHNEKLPPYEQNEKGPSRSWLSVPLRKRKGRYRRRQRRTLGAVTFATRKAEEEKDGGTEEVLCFCLSC